MSVQIVEEGRFLLYCFLSGIIITIAYDGFRIFRRVCAHGILWITLEDLLFWMGAGIFLFYMLYKTNNGVIRWFSVVGAACGMLVYKYTIGEHIVEIMSTLIKKVQHIVSRCLYYLFRPAKRLIKRMFGKAKRYLKKIKKVSKKKLTGNIKKFKITLCKRKNTADVRGHNETEKKKKGRLSR